MVRRSASGMTVRQIVHEMRISKTTWYHHRSNIFAKMEVQTMAEVWMKLGWLKTEGS